MKSEDVEKTKEYLNNVKYKPNAFTWYLNGQEVVWGVLLKDQPGFNKLFSYGTLYDTVLDVDEKIKYSVIEATKLAEVMTDTDWDPFKKPSKDEWIALYYMENALFRVTMLWDLLAQIYNLKEDIGKPVERIYAEQFFHDAQQGKKPNPFAKKVYAYMMQEEEASSEEIRGNYKFVRDYRHKMMHRYSPSVSTASEYAVDLRLPAIYYLARLLEDYVKVSEFIQELFAEITKDFEKLIPQSVKGANYV